MSPFRRPATRRPLLVFLGVAVAVLVVIALATVIGARLIARQEALRDAERTTSRLASLVVGPLLAEALAGNAERRAQLDRAVADRLADGSITEVTVWALDGTVVYAGEAGTIGQRFEPSAAVRAAIVDGTTSAAIETADETGGLPDEPFLEVYVPLLLPDRPPLAFEAYYDTGPVDRRAADLTLELAVFGLVPLLVLQLVQIPIALSLARRVVRQETERAALLERALSASDRERRAIAADLHDGVVQDLAGVGYAIGALPAAAPDEQQTFADLCSATVGGAVDALRRLIVDIYPPDLAGPGLAVAMDDLATPLRTRGTAVTVDVGVLPSMAPEAAATLYRVTKEALTNVDKHAAAAHVHVELGAAEIDGAPGVRVAVTDDGIGVPADAARRAEGHFGVTMLGDRVADLGGRFSIGPGPGPDPRRGTVVEAVLPAHPAS